MTRPTIDTTPKAFPAEPSGGSRCRWCGAKLSYHALSDLEYCLSAMRHETLDPFGPTISRRELEKELGA